MAGVIPIVPPRTGTMVGKLDVETERFVTFDEACAHLPEVKAFFDELDRKGWSFLLIDCNCRVIMELDIASAPYVWQSYEAPRGGFAYKLAFDFGRSLPKLSLKKIVSFDRCVVNIRSRDYARGVTIDLTKKEITYVNESLWVSRGEGCAEKAKGVLEILRWLAEDKKYRIAASGGEKHYRDLVSLLGGK
jgi:hypothetical protein